MVGTWLWVWWPCKDEWTQCSPMQRSHPCIRRAMALLERPGTMHGLAWTVFNVQWTPAHRAYSWVEMDDWGGKSGSTMLLCLRDYLTGEVQCHTTTSVRYYLTASGTQAVEWTIPSPVKFSLEIYRSHSLLASNLPSTWCCTTVPGMAKLHTVYLEEWKEPCKLYTLENNDSAK